MAELSHKRGPNSVAVLIALLAAAAAAILVGTGADAWGAAMDNPGAFASFVGLTLGLQLMGVEVYGRGRISVAGIGMLATGFTFGVGAAMATAILAAVVHALHARVRPDRALFNVMTFAIAAGAATATYQLVSSPEWNAFERLGPALLAGGMFWIVNTGLVTFVMMLSEEGNPFAIWNERFRWLTVHYLAFGPLALASAAAYERVGISGLVAFLVPPALMIFSVHQYLARTRESVENLRSANAELAARNEDLHELLEFAGGLASRAHDRTALLEYAEDALTRLAGAPAQIKAEADGAPLLAGGEPVGFLSVGDQSDSDRERWENLREGILPQLATSLESAELVERVKKRHLDTIAALSRSMEAKDYYTGGHTERVSTVALALAQRLGFAGDDLAAVEVGALLHDIGKIGIPERILHKPGPLDTEEWKVMKEHPVISDYILSEVDLHPIVREIARSSHERVDGAGYPDGLAGDDIPLAARIVLVADAFDALTSDRPYRDGRDPWAALSELRSNAGTQFCDSVVAALEDLVREQPDVLGIERFRSVA